MKNCIRCGKRKRLSSFYAHPSMGDGHLNKCKECCKADAAAARLTPEAMERDRIRNRKPHRVAARKKYAKSERGRERHQAGTVAWQKRNPEKRKAHHAVSNAIRDGKLVKGPCEKCGSTKVQAHHDDYSKPLEVRWLCIKDHNAEHRH